MAANKISLTRLPNITVSSCNVYFTKSLRGDLDIVFVDNNSLNWQDWAQKSHFNEWLADHYSCMCGKLRER